MTPQEIFSIVLGIMSGKPWSPPGNSSVTVRAEPSMNFVVKRNGQTLDVVWSPPYPTVTAKAFGIGITGELKGAKIEQGKLTPIVSRLPDIEIAF